MNNYVQLIIMYDNEVIVIKEKGNKIQKYTLPFGMLEVGEIPLQCAIRVAYEMLGVIICQNDLDKIYDIVMVNDHLNQHVSNIIPMKFIIKHKQELQIYDERIEKALYMKKTILSDEIQKNKELSNISNYIEEKINK